MKIEDLAGAASRAESKRLAAERLEQAKKAKAIEARQKRDNKTAKKDEDYAPYYDLARRNRAIYDRASRLDHILTYPGRRRILLGSLSLDGIDEHARDVQLFGVASTSSEGSVIKRRYYGTLYKFTSSRFMLDIVTKDHDRLSRSTLPLQSSDYQMATSYQHNKIDGYWTGKKSIEYFCPSGYGQRDFTLREDISFADIHTAEVMRGKDHGLFKEKKRSKRLGQIATQQDAFVETLELFEQAAADSNLNPEIAKRIGETTIPVPELSRARDLASD